MSWTNAVRTSHRVAMLVVALFSGVAHAQAADAFDVGRFEAYLDGLAAAQFNDHKLAGMTFSLVRADRVILTRGYGYADVASQTPVDPDYHLFRPGSVSKLFTWTAVMQLVEAGQLDLDADVNDYVTQFEVPNEFDTPMTLTHILTHTPGLEDRFTNLFEDDVADTLPLAEALARGMPAQVRPPGTVASYSNWATALAGLIVANVSGMSFERYVQERILNRLAMTQATFEEPLPDRLAAAMATGYVTDEASLAEYPFEYVRNFGPAGAMSASAGDLARFMLAHLNGGAHDGARILSAESVQRMHEPLFSHHPDVAAVAHGFYEKHRNGQRFVGHGGDTIAFHSEMVLDPENRLGFFVSFNSAEGAQARAAVVNGVIDYFYPPPPRRFTYEPLEGSAARIAEVVGGYRFNRRSFTTFEAITGLAGDIPIAPSKDAGAIQLPVPNIGGKFHEVAPYVFEQAGRGTRLVFTPGDGGMRMLIGPVPVMVAEKVGFATSAGNHQLVLALTLLASLFVLINYARNRRDGLSGGPARGRLALVIAAAAAILFGAGLGLQISSLDMNYVVFEFPPAGTGALLVLPWLVLGATLVAVAYLPQVWQAGACNVWARLRYTWMVVLFALFLLVLNYWNMLGWKY